MGDDLTVPEPWQALPRAGLSGPILIVGGPDSGKSALARYLYRQFRQQGQPVAYVDGDPGQSTLGPPATVALGLSSEQAEDTFPPDRLRRLWFVGSTTPRGHMLPLLAGAARLLQDAHRASAGPIIYDSSGLVDPRVGGAALKLALVDVLQPQLIIAIQSRRELEPLLLSWRKQRGLELVELTPAPAARRRDTAERQAHRAAQFARYFRPARQLTLDLDRYAITPAVDWQPQRLLALRDDRGFTLALAIMQEQTAAGEVVVLTPLPEADAVVAIQVGDLLLDPQTYRDQIIR